MARALLSACLFACVVSAQKPPEALPPPAAQPSAQIPEPPEEDEALIPKVYALNPVQAKKEITAGDYYFKKPNYSAALKRYVEATRWDPGSAEAFLKLGEVHEKLREYGPARDAYLKFIELGGDAKESEALRKKMEKWPGASPAAKAKSSPKSGADK